jgi:menaquinol-cytochrome c reductase iron-sulfur subunit
MSHPQPPPNPERRDFFKRAGAVTIGGVISAVPVIAGMAVALDPLRRKAQAGEPVRITTLDTLPADGIPRKFSVVADRSDAWNKFPHVPIGAVYLRRVGEKKIEAFNAVCPHAGCFVDFVAARNGFFCPCHNSSFAVNGSIADSRSPSPRALDALTVEIRNDAEVWVIFQNFRAGQAEKAPVA